LYKPVDPRVSFPAMEEQILSFWETNNIFQKSVDQHHGKDQFLFYDGPPFATGLPHFGHFVPGTIKDIIPRYQTMKGKKVVRRFGWDCHGLPVEYEMEKELGISGKSQIEAYGVDKFNEACRGIVLRYTSEWQKTVTRMGRWVDFENDYKTMDPDYMESIWWVFKSLWEQDLIYEGYYILPYSPALATPLSNFEVNLGGYKEVHDPAITVRFRVIKDNNGELSENPSLKDVANLYFLAWTTTPWTLPSNLALALGPELDYVRVADTADPSSQYIIAEQRLTAYYKNPEDYTVVQRYKGKDLKGWTYEPLFTYFADLADEGAFTTYNAEYVTIEDGTGIVHIAPGFGEDDYQVLKDSGLPVLCPIDAEAKFLPEITDFQGIYVKDADKLIIQKLKDEGKLVKRENYLHPYPHCYRTGKPLIYRAISSWFVRIDKIKDKMLRANDTILWMPGHLQKGRFGKWLENARDWAISRNRYWGNPIPVWKCDVSGEVVCVGSRDELAQLSGIRPDDLHKHFVDEITWPSAAGGTFRRVPEVLDCWFESGAMPYAQSHYPFENKDTFEANFPADFICEGLDQTRGWFYTLTVLAAALFDAPPSKAVVVNGLVLAEDGRKMSKSARNYSDPVQVINTFGADALRLFLMNSGVVRAEDLKYSDDGVKEVLKQVILPLWNAYSFYVTYANIDQVAPTEPPSNPDNPLDRWILSELNSLIEKVTNSLDSYDLQKAVEPLVAFIDQLNNWYIRRSRRRFWRSENDNDKEQAYQTLHTVLLELVKVAAPFIPFISEEIYQNLKPEGAPESVHLCEYPVIDTARRDLILERKMHTTQEAVRMGRAIRSLHNLKIRQPLNGLHLVTKDREEKNILIEMEDIIREELNVKEVIFRDNEEDLVEYSAKANYRTLGKVLGKDMKLAADKIQQLTASDIMGLMDGATLSLDVADRSIDITLDDILVQREEKQGLKVLNEGSLTVALDPVVTQDLKQEGLVRDLIRGIQNLRKDSGFEVSDRILLQLHLKNELLEAVQTFEEYLAEEVLAQSVIYSTSPLDVSLDSGDISCTVNITKV
jgi:isoleucyl-tRNA synthetase